MNIVQEKCEPAWCFISYCRNWSIFTSHPSAAHCTLVDSLCDSGVGSVGGHGDAAATGSNWGDHYCRCGGIGEPGLLWWVNRVICWSIWVEKRRSFIPQHSWHGRQHWQMVALFPLNNKVQRLSAHTRFLSPHVHIVRFFKLYVCKSSVGVMVAVARGMRVALWKDV